MGLWQSFGVAAKQTPPSPLSLAVQLTDTYFQHMLAHPLSSLSPPPTRSPMSSHRDQHSKLHQTSARREEAHPHPLSFPIIFNPAGRQRVVFHRGKNVEKRSGNRNKMIITLASGIAGIVTARGGVV